MANDNNAQWNNSERALLDGLIDAIIPADADTGLPAASTLGVADFIEESIQETPGLGEQIAQGLAGAIAFMEDRGTPDLKALNPDDREAAARALESSDPEFFVTLVRLTYIRYYTHPSIPPHFGLPDHPPQPEGNELPPDDPEVLARMLEPVVKRGNIFREV